MSGRGTRILFGVIVLTMVGGVAFWAGRVTMRPPEVTERAPDSSVVVEVVEQEIGRVLTLTTTVSRTSRPLAVNAATGVVRSVVADGEYGQGDVLYRVGGSAVTLVEGDTPFWRDLAEESEGPDVAPVQEMLNAWGAELDVDGVWGAVMTEVVEDWQEDVGAEVDGVIALGEVVAAAGLPVSLSLDHAVAWPGAVLGGGETVVSIPAGEPSFFMELTPNQAELVRSGAQVRIQHGQHEWEGVTLESTPNELGMFEMSVSAPGGGLPCGSDCAELPATGELHLLTEVTIIPPVTGPIVPLAAVTTRPDGTTSVQVVGQGGTVATHAVTVLAVAEGVAVLDGIEVGQQVQVLGGDPATVPEPDRAPDDGDTNTGATPEP